MDRKGKILAMNEANAAVLVELITGANVSESLRIQAMEKLSEAKVNDSFFKTMFTESLDFGACPHCGHENFWLTPEDELNQMGWVSHKEDGRIPENTDADSCPKYQQACKKKKINT